MNVLRDLRDLRDLCKSAYRWAFAPLVLGVVAFALGGCSTYKTYFESDRLVDESLGQEYWDYVGQQYRNYVEMDPKLTPEQKERRVFKGQEYSYDVGKQYRHYVEMDPKLTPEQKERRMRNFYLWRSR